MDLQEFWKQFRSMNSRQLFRSLLRKVKTHRHMQEFIDQLKAKETEAIGRFSGIVEINRDSLGCFFVVPYYEKYGKKENDDCVFQIEDSPARKIAFAMKDYPAPFSKYEVQRFVDFFEMRIDVELMFAAATTDEQYQEWVDAEIRMNTL